jgi:hypothetical protein
LHMLKKARRHWRWRPGQQVAADPRKWWQFAIHCVLDVVHRTRSAMTNHTDRTNNRVNNGSTCAFMGCIATTASFSYK